MNQYGGMAQWQSIRLQIEMSSVQLRVPPKRKLCSINWITSPTVNTIVKLNNLSCEIILLENVYFVENKI